MISRRQDFSSGQSIEPDEIGLKVAVVPGHRQIAREQDQVARNDALAPVFLDAGRVIVPPGSVALAPIGSRKRKMKVRDRPNIHRSLPTK